jgi:hypothetical protein
MAADLVLAAHFAIVLFIVGGFLLVPLGAGLGWAWVRRRGWRLVHLGAIVFVAAETLAGIACPLTVLEDGLRGADRGGPGFVERWIGRLLYWDLPGWVFAAGYTLAALAALMLWRAVPPQPRR